jgi:prepilin-type processing-associated H-X9-DG protein
MTGRPGTLGRSQGDNAVFHRLMRRYPGRAFALRDVVVVMACLSICGGLLPSCIAVANRASRQAGCAMNLHTLYGGLIAYVNTYNTFPPHAPYPTVAPAELVNGMSTGGWDPNLGWILTYGLGLEPPARYPNGHFKWAGVDRAKLPSVCLCPSIRAGLFDPTDSEVDANAPLESVAFQYALAYQTSGTLRAATPVSSDRGTYGPSLGGRNAPVADPSRGYQHGADNSQHGTPYIWVEERSSWVAPDDPSGGTEWSCWIQAVDLAEVDVPSRVYYLADSRDYRPGPAESLRSWPPAGTNAGWYSRDVNKICLGSRHEGYANVLYMDGNVSADNQAHPPPWNMDYDEATGQAHSDRWRAATFSADIHLASIHTQLHIMPVLMVKGWEFFLEGGKIPQ